MSTTSTAQPAFETLRGLLLGQPVGTNGVLALFCCAGIALASYLWSRALLKRV